MYRESLVACLREHRQLAQGLTIGLVAFELRNSGGKPGPARIPNQQRRTGTHGRKRHRVLVREYVVDSEISVGLQRDTLVRRAEFVEWRCSVTYERGMNALVRIGPDTVAAAEEQPSPAGPDVTHGINLSLESADDPDLTRRGDSADSVPAHGHWSVRDRLRYVRHGDHA